MLVELEGVFLWMTLRVQVHFNLFTYYVELFLPRHGRLSPMNCGY